MLTDDAVPVPAVAPLFMAPWEEARPATLPAPAPSFHADSVRHYPWHVFVSDTVSRGDSLLWSPLEGCGVPFFAQWRTRCLSPFSLPFYYLDPVRGMQLSVFLKLFLAGVCAFVAARRLFFAPALALFVALTFQMSGYFLYWMASPLADTLPWAPFLLVCADRLSVGRLYYWPFAALVFGLMLLGGDPETVVGLFLLLMVFILARNLFCRRTIRQLSASAGAFAFSLLVGIALIALQVLPFAELAMEAVSLGHSAGEASLRAVDLVVMFVPHFFGGPAFLQADGAFADVGRALPLLHVGVIQLLLLPLWLALRGHSTPPQRHRIEAMLAASGALTLVVALGGGYLRTMPLLRLLGPEHLLAGNALLFGVAAAAAAEEWLHLDVDGCTHTLKRLPVFLALAALLGGILLVMESRLRGLAFDADTLRRLYLAGGFGALFLLLLGATLLRPSERLMGYALSAVAAVQLFVTLHPGDSPVLFADRTRLFPKTAFVTHLQALDARVCGSGSLKEWPLSGNLIPQAYSAGGVQLRRNAAFFERAEADPLLLRRTGSGGLMLTRTDIQETFAEVRPLLQLEHVLPSGAGIFANLAAKPRAWVAFEGRFAEEFDPAELSPDLPPLMEGVVPPKTDNGAKATAVIAPDATHVSIPVHVDCDRPGVLVLSDSWYPGWTATVQGQEAQIFPVDGMFRGVHVPEGAGDVVFSYRPASLRTGMMISAATALLLLVVIVMQGVRRIMLPRPDPWER